VQTNLDHLLLATDFHVQPYAAYRQLREEAPVYWSEAWQAWLITRHDHAVEVLRQPEVFSSAGRFKSLFEQFRGEQAAALIPIREHFATGIISSDPPTHTRIRKLIRLGFTPRVVARLESTIRRLVDELLDEVADVGRMDVVEHLAYPLPVTVIAELLGFPREDRDLLRRWSNDVMDFQESGNVPFEVVQRAQTSIYEMRDYVAALFSERRQHPRDDLISGLVAAEEGGDRLTHEELLTTCVSILVAGHETTTSLIANAVLALLQHPDQLQQLKDDPSLAEGAVEEVLRYEAPLQRIRRRVTKDLEFYGRSIKAEELFLLIVGSVNRDPDHFSNPDRFDIRRPDRHLAFGYGIHFCVGAPLARVEAPLAVNALLRRMPRIQMEDQTPRWDEFTIVRRQKSLPVSF